MVFIWNGAMQIHWRRASVHKTLKAAMVTCLRSNRIRTIFAQPYTLRVFPVATCLSVCGADILLCPNRAGSRFLWNIACARVCVLDVDIWFHFTSATVYTGRFLFVRWSVKVPTHHSYGLHTIAAHERFQCVNRQENWFTFAACDSWMQWT